MKEEIVVEVRNVSKIYESPSGDITVLNRVNMKIKKGEFVAIVGDSGSGKTTLLNLIGGMDKVSKGSITVAGKQISNFNDKQRTLYRRNQVGFSFQDYNLIQELTVYENLLMGAYCQPDKKRIKEDVEEIYTHFPRLGERKNQVAGTLSGGEQQMLAMGRAMMSHPDLLMLDEPSMGLSPLLVDEVFDIIVNTFNKKGTTILLVEQNAGKSLAISDRAYVLENGKIVLSGTGNELMQSDEVKKAYLGG